MSERAVTQHPVFFDFFGTLVDYEPSIRSTYNAALAFARQAWAHLEAHAASTGPEFSMHEVAQRSWR